MWATAPGPTSYFLRVISSDCQSYSQKCTGLAWPAAGASAAAARSPASFTCRTSARQGAPHNVTIF